MNTEQQQEWFKANHKYHNQPQNNGLTREQFTARLNQLGNTTLDRINKLSDDYGDTLWAHPRTGETHRFAKREVIPKTLLRKGSIAYGQQANRQEKGLRFSKPEVITKWVSGDKRVKPKATGEIRKTAQWKTVWYSRNMRRR